MKKRMYSCIVVVGGGLMFPGAQSWLQYLVWTHMPSHMRLALDTMDVITKPKVSQTVMFYRIDLPVNNNNNNRLMAFVPGQPR